MKKFKMPEYMIKDFEAKIKKFENGELSKEIIIEELDDISKTYIVPFGLRLNAIKLKKAKIKDVVTGDNDSLVEPQNEVTIEENIMEAETAETVLDEENVMEAETAETVLDEENAIVVKADDVNKIKEFFKNRKKAIATGAVIATLALAGGTLLYGHTSKNSDNDTVEDISDDIDNTLKEKELSENLAFDPLDKELEVEMMKKFFADALPKGVELTETDLENQIDKWINFKNLANFDEFGISDLASKYQNDKVTYIDIYNDYTACATILTYDSLTASKEKGELIDLSYIFAEKDALELVSTFQDMNGQLVDARKAKDEAKMMEIAKAYNTLIEEKLMSHDVDAYNPIAYDLSIRYALNAKEIVLDYQNVQNTLMDKSLEDVLAVNGQCLTGEEAAKIMNGEIPGFTNKYSTNVIKMLEDIKLKFSEMYRNLDKDFSDELSQAEEVSMISKYILENNLISTYVANISYEEYYYEVKDLENTGSTMPKGSVKVNDNSYVTKEEIYEKTGIDTENTNLSDAEIKSKYEENVRQETDKILKEESGITDINGEIQENVTKEEYVKYYELGSSMGAKAAIGKTTKISTASVPSSVPSQYHEVFTNAYVETYNSVVEQNLKALGDTTTEYVPTTEQEVSREEDIQISNPINDKDIISSNQRTTEVLFDDSRLTQIQNEIENLQVIKAMSIKAAQYVENYYEDVYTAEVKTYTK